MEKIIKVPSSTQNNCFDSIVQLHKGGFTNKSEIIGIVNDDTSIVTKQYNFVKTDAYGDIAEQPNRLESDGSTWFKNMMSDKESENALWQMFVEQTALYFHRNYSLLEFAPIRNISVGESEKKADIDMLNNLFAYVNNGAYSHKLQIDTIRAGDNDFDDIYRTTLRVGISDGTGEPKPIIASLYFQNNHDGKGLTPLQKNHATIIKNSLIAFDGDQDHRTTSSRDTIVGSLMNNISDLIEQDVQLQEYLVLESDQDSHTLDDILSRSPEDTVNIYCRSIDVLNVCHVKMYTHRYTVNYDNILMYNATVRLGGDISLQCALCGQMLINNNCLTLADRTQLQLRPAHHLLGLDDNCIAKLSQDNIFYQHCIKISCNNLHDVGSCSRYVCQDQVFDVDASKYPPKFPQANMVAKLCLDCPYQECVQTYKSKHYHTRQMQYCLDVSGLVPYDDVARCKLCGRHFDNLNMMGLCNTCSDLTAGSRNSDSRYHRLFSKYKSLVPLSKRLLVPKKDKLCNEDESLIVFVVGKKTMVFDKYDINDRLHINYAVEVKYTKRG